MGFGVTFDTWWTGTTGREIGQRGGCAAQVVAHYLTANPHANMIGLYHVRLSIAREHIGTLTARVLERAMVVIGETGFADYDTATEYVWVREMARFRLQLDKKTRLVAKDKRRIGAVKLFTSVRPNPFLAPFHAKYRLNLQLPEPRAFNGEWKPLRYPLREPCISGISNQESLSRDPKSDQADQEQRADAHRVLVRLAHDALTSHPDDAKEELKTLAARAGIPYDSESIRKALDAAEHQRKQRRVG